MQIFQSVPGHSGELSIANHSSQPTAPKLKCASDIISNWFENRQPQQTKFPPSLTHLSFKTRIKWLLGHSLTATISSPRVFFSTSAIVTSVSLFRYYIKQIYFMSPCVCLVIDHRRRQNVVRTSVTHWAIASCATFLFLPHFDVICDLLLNRRTATWNLFVK